LVDAGIHVSLATDNVPPTMFVPIGHAVSRLTDAGKLLGPGQAISRLEALACASREGAWLSFEEEEKGTIEVSRHADLAVLSEDLLTCNATDIPEITADLTIVGGKVVFEREG
ncbi:MAG: amidohydrolase family protein, partial [Hyphomicrobiaceae bacterium]